VRRTKRARVVTRLAVVVVASLVGTACAGPDASHHQSAVRVHHLVSAAALQDDAQGTGNGLASSVPLKPSAATGGTLRVGVAGDVDFLDPARTYFAFSWDIHQLISRTMLTYPDGTGQQAVFPIGDIATGPATPTNNDMIWAYTLKTGIKFQDGTPVTSQSIKYAIERTFASTFVDNGPTYFATFLCPGGESESGICPTYGGPYTDHTPDHLGLSTIKTPDATHITFDLNQPFSEWNYVMTLLGTSPVEPRIDLNPKTGGANYNTHVQATGPYEIASYVPDKRIDLVRNPEYNPTTDGTRPALPNKIDITTSFAPMALDRSIIANRTDLDIGGVGVQPTTQSAILGSSALEARSLDPITGFTRYLSILQETPPFNNVHCRRAVEWATSTAAQQGALGGPYSGALATTLAPPTLAGWKDFDLYPATNNRAPNVTKAKRELSLCGEPNGFTTTIVVSNHGSGPQQATLLAEDLKAVGITANIRAFDPSTYFSSVIGVPATIRKDGFGLAFAIWGPDWPAPYGFFENIVDPRRILPQGNGNYGACGDPRITSLIETALHQATPTSEDRYWQQVDQTVLGDACVVPLTYTKALDLFSQRLKNVDIEPWVGIVDLRILGVK
jgi:peptide/nickel transport system substrate-binding protein